MVVGLDRGRSDRRLHIQRDSDGEPGFDPDAHRSLPTVRSGEVVDDVGGRAGGGVAISGSGPEVQAVGVSGLAGRLAQRTGEVVHSRVLSGCRLLVPVDEAVAQRLGRSAGECPGDDRLVVPRIGQCMAVVAEVPASSVRSRRVPTPTAADPARRSATRDHPLTCIHRRGTGTLPSRRQRVPDPPLSARRPSVQRRSGTVSSGVVRSRCLSCCCARAGRAPDMIDRLSDGRPGRWGTVKRSSTCASRRIPESAGSAESLFVPGVLAAADAR